MDDVQNWHRADIIAALHKRGISLAQLSRQSGLSRSTLRNALDRRWPKGERIIAEAIGKKPEAIWPQRYYKHTLEAGDTAPRAKKDP